MVFVSVWLTLVVNKIFCCVSVRPRLTNWKILSRILGRPNKFCQSSASGPYLNQFLELWNALKLFRMWNTLKPLEMVRILFENPVRKCRGKSILLVCVHYPRLPVISPPGSFATNQLATNAAKSPRHQRDRVLLCLVVLCMKYSRCLCLVEPFKSRFDLRQESVHLKNI